MARRPKIIKVGGCQDGCLFYGIASDECEECYADSRVDFAGMVHNDNHWRPHDCPLNKRPIRVELFPEPDKDIEMDRAKFCDLAKGEILQWAFSHDFIDIEDYEAREPEAITLALMIYNKVATEKSE